jgi:hypothetical protein
MPPAESIRRESRERVGLDVDIPRPRHQGPFVLLLVKDGCSLHDLVAIKSLTEPHISEDVRTSSKPARLTTEESSPAPGRYTVEAARYL